MTILECACCQGHLYAVDRGGAVRCLNVKCPRYLVELTTEADALDAIARNETEEIDHWSEDVRDAEE